MHRIDRVLAVFGLERRKSSRAGVRAGSFAGATSSRLLEWAFASIKSANQEVKADHRTLVQRSRDLARNTSFGKRFLGLVERNVVGPAGIRLQARATRPDGSLDESINQKIEAAWREWCRPENCTVDGRLGWRDVQGLTVKTWGRDGEYLVRLLEGWDNRFGLALQLIDPDQLDIEYNEPARAGGNEIRMGVEIDRWGRPLAYHCWSDHPEEYGRSRTRVRIPAEEIIHDFIPDRVGQTRGVPWYHAILTDSRMLAGLYEAELVASRLSASAMGFVKITDPEAVPDPDAPASGAELEIQAEPGSFPRLPFGHDVTTWAPEHPTTAFEPFTKAILRGIAAGLDVSYDGLTGDLADVNYSSIRAGKLDERDVWRVLQERLATHLHRRVFLAFLRSALTTGALELPSRNMARWSDHEWLARGWDWVDPEKDAKAELLEVGAGVNSLTRIAAEQGRDLEEVLAERRREIELARRYGVPISLQTSGAAPGGERAEERGGNGNGRAHGGVNRLAALAPLTE